MTQNQTSITVHKNKKRAFWSLVLIAFMLPVSLWLLVLGLQPGRPEIGWFMVLFGTAGLIAFGIAAFAVIGTMRSTWRLELNPAHLALYAPTYDLLMPWDGIAGIAVDKVGRRLGCALVFEDVSAAVQGATFHRKAAHPGAVVDAATMKVRMEENFNTLGYHLGIPDRILELDPEELAELLAKARRGQLWKEEEKAE